MKESAYGSHALYHTQDWNENEAFLKIATGRRGRRRGGGVVRRGIEGDRGEDICYDFVCILELVGCFKSLNASEICHRCWDGLRSVLCAALTLQLVVWMWHAEKVQVNANTYLYYCMHISDPLPLPAGFPGGDGVCVCLHILVEAEQGRKHSISFTFILWKFSKLHKIEHVLFFFSIC